MTRCAVLSLVPPSPDHRDRMEAMAGESLRWWTVEALRSLGWLRMLRTLRALEADELFLALSHEGSEGYLPLLCGVAIFTRARTFTVVDIDTKVASLSRAEASGLAVRAAASSLSAALMTGGNIVRLLLLRRRRRLELRGSTRGTVLYLHTNIRGGMREVAGGVHAHIIGILNELARRGLDVEYWGTWLQDGIRPEVRFHRVSMPQTYALGKTFNLHRANLIAEGSVAKGVTCRPDFVYQRVCLHDITGVVLSRRLRVPLVAEFNGSEGIMARLWDLPLRSERIIRLAEDVCLRHAHVVVTVSEPLRDLLISRGVEPARIVCHPNGVDTDRFDSTRFDDVDRQRVRAELGVPADAVVVMFVGTFGAWHGVETLAQAARSLFEDAPGWLAQTKAHFVFVGEGPNLAKTRAVVASSPVHMACTFTGLIAQARGPEVMAAADILVSPQIPQPDGRPFIGSPTKLFEYMAMGKGIVASALDQMAEVMQPSLRAATLPAGAPAAGAVELGVLCTPGDVVELAAAIRFLVESPAWRTVLGSNARQRALERHTWGSHVDRIIEAIPRSTGGR